MPVFMRFVIFWFWTSIKAFGFLFRTAFGWVYYTDQETYDVKSENLPYGDFLPLPPPDEPPLPPPDEPPLPLEPLPPEAAGLVESRCDDPAS